MNPLKNPQDHAGGVHKNKYKFRRQTGPTDHTPDVFPGDTGEVQYFISDQMAAAVVDLFEIIRACIG